MDLSVVDKSGSQAPPGLPEVEAQCSCFGRWAAGQDNEGLGRDSGSSGEVTAQPPVGYNQRHSPPAVTAATAWLWPRERAEQCGGLWVGTAD